ncbi:recombinase RecT [Cupriavidus metallidurans]
MTTEPKKELTPFKAFTQEFAKQRDSIEKVMPPGVDLERFMRTALLAVQAKPELLDADRKSLMLSCMRAAQDGLLPDGREAALNVYNTKMKVWSEEYQREVDQYVPVVQYLPMVRGIVKIMYECGVLKINAAAANDADHFRYLRGDADCIEHEPYDGPNDPGLVKAAYVIFKLASGEIHREVMYRRDIERVRAASKNGDRGPWVQWYDQMAIKSVIKRAAKLLPWSPESMDRITRVIQHDNEAIGYLADDDVQASDAPAQQAKPTPTPAPAALPDERAQQAANTVNRPSRMAGIVNKQRQAAPATRQAQQAGPFEEIPLHAMEHA